MRVIVARSRQLSALLILPTASPSVHETTFPGTLTENVCPVFLFSFFSLECQLSDTNVIAVRVTGLTDCSPAWFVCLFLIL